MTRDPGSGADRLAALRGELRALGYLEGQLERYLVRDLFARPGLLAPALRASLRAAALGGPLVAAGITAFLVLWHPELGRRPADLAVLLGYVALFACLACFALALGAAVAGLTARLRPPELARLVTAVTTGVWLAWLVPWALFQGGTLRLLAVAGLGAVAVLLGRVGGLTALVFALDRGAPGSFEARSVGHEIRRAGLVLAGSVVGFTGLAALGAQPRPEPQAAPISARPGGAPVLLVAIDGLGWDDLAGRLGPLSARIAELGRSGLLTRLAPGAVPVPPVVWTTIATGRPPLEHGVRSLLVEQVPGLDTAFPSGYGRDALAAVLRALAPAPPPRAPLSDSLRREKALWEVAAEAHLEVLVVNWWATYPASIARGTVISDRAYSSLVAGRELSREVVPAELGNALAAAWRREPPVASPPGFSGAAADAFRSDVFHAEVGLGRLSETRPRASALYLQALDVMAAEAGDEARASAARAAYGSWLDSMLARLGPWLEDGGTLMLVGHPGRVRLGQDGVLLIAGGPVRPAVLPGPAGLEDVAPTALVLLGLPSSEEQVGRALLDAIDPGFLERVAPARVASFGRRQADPAPAFDPTDSAAEERLRSLGYVN